MGGILLFVAGLIGATASVSVLNSDYGFWANVAAWAYLIVLTIILLGMAFVLIVKGNRDDSEIATDRSYDRVEPGETVEHKDGTISDTKWTQETKARTAYHDERDH